MRIIQLLLIISLALSSAVLGLARDVSVPMPGPVSPAQPRLLNPIGDTVSLTGKDNLEFRWQNPSAPIDHTIFKLYKGYNMYESDLLYTQNLPANENSIKVKSDSFMDSQAYTWSLVQVGLDGQKSEKTFGSFKVIDR